MATRILYFSTRKQAVEHAREERAQGHPVEMNRWEIIGEHEPTHQPVELDRLIAEAERREAEEEASVQEMLNAALPPMPQSVLQDVARALLVE